MRVGRVRVIDATIARFGPDGVPLAILGAPKGQQTRFYVARDEQGRAQPSGNLTKQAAGYRTGKGLRGRKVYPHHLGLPPDHWDNPTEDRTAKPVEARIYQEYRRPQDSKGESRDDQNRSVEDWIAAGSVFEFELQVTNLAQVELGALLYLLTLPEGQFLRFGGGKPLGFGSVRLQLVAEGLDLADGSALAAEYKAFGEHGPAGEQIRDLGALSAPIEAFRRAAVEQFGPGASFDTISFIAAFRRACTGFEDGLPTHYPRTRPPGASGHTAPRPEGLSYEWFDRNERGEYYLSLPDLEDDPGLPLF
ncbi:MAG: TIGR03986 family CRISPR-associated RAMP protein [Candidatus Riflebacteria bacterium]|nr:TIGR03986 family CRISPR-associated RAMP protein [Candidatus Riflebacteria bacterium]